jgi:hypothetical protein
MLTRTFVRPSTLVLLLVAAGACAADVPATSPRSELISRTALITTSSACVANPTAIVADEASLHAAIAAAQPGDVIAIQGTIPLLVGADVETPGVTLTCATPGSGLAFAPGTAEGSLIYAMANDVVVRGLALDARGPEFGSAVYSDQTNGQRTERNTITCGGDACSFWNATTNIVVTDNVVTATQPLTSGLHFQENIDGAHIERNSVTTTMPNTGTNFGGIRPRDGVNVVVRDNVVRGPWSISISSVNLSDSRLEKNVMEGATRYGFAINVAGSVHAVFSRGNLGVANRVSNTGIAAYYLRNACFNGFHANLTQGTTPVAFFLETTTGGNKVTGNSGPSVDLGAYDCDGDGVNDPNRVNSSGALFAAAPASSLMASLQPSLRQSRFDLH